MIKATIGISLEKFNILLLAFTAAYDAVQLERCQKGEIKNVSKGGPKGHLDTFEKKLFFILYYLKTYPTFDVLGFHFGFSSGHAHNHVENLMPVLLRSLADLGVLPARSPGTPAEFLQLVEQYGDILIDGMECPCVRPQDEELQKARYSGKKNAPCSRPSSARPCTGKSFSSAASSPEASMTTRSLKKYSTPN